jgi:hypothetical protein
MSIKVSSHNIEFRGKPYTVLFHNDHVMQIIAEHGSKLCRGHKSFGEIGRLAKLGATVHPVKFRPRLNLLILLDPPQFLAS